MDSARARSIRGKASERLPAGYAEVWTVVAVSTADRTDSTWDRIATRAVPPPLRGALGRHLRRRRHLLTSRASLEECLARLRERPRFSRPSDGQTLAVRTASRNEFGARLIDGRLRRRYHLTVVARGRVEQIGDNTQVELMVRTSRPQLFGYLAVAVLYTVVGIGALVLALRNPTAATTHPAPYAICLGFLLGIPALVRFVMTDNTGDDDALVELLRELLESEDTTADSQVSRNDSPLRHDPWDDFWNEQR